MDIIDKYNEGAQLIMRLTREVMSDDQLFKLYRNGKLTVVADLAQWAIEMSKVVAADQADPKTTLTDGTGSLYAPGTK